MDLPARRLGTDACAPGGDEDPLDLADAEGRTALHVAAQAGRADACRALLRGGADAELWTTTCGSEIFDALSLADAVEKLNIHLGGCCLKPLGDDSQLPRYSPPPHATRRERWALAFTHTTLGYESGRAMATLPRCPPGATRLRRHVVLALSSRW